MTSVGDAVKSNTTESAEMVKVRRFTKPSLMKEFHRRRRFAR
jgi:hypothetical protein